MIELSAGADLRHGAIWDWLTRTVDAVLNSPRTLWFLVLTGLVLRFAQYMSDRSLWLDEAYLALNLIDRSYSELLKPLTYHQYAPVGFLITQKWLISVFGTNEYAMRLFPFLCGASSCAVFALVARRLLSSDAANLAMGLFALSDGLIFYAAELKQYSTDVLVTLIICLLFQRFLEFPGKATSAAFAAGGALLIWFSHPAVFVLAGTGTTALLLLWRKTGWRSALAFGWVVAIWMLSFAITYKLFLAEPVSSPDLRSSFSTHFLPQALDSIRSINAYVRLFFMMFSEALGFTLAGICALAFVVGLFSLWRFTRPAPFFIHLVFSFSIAVSVLGFYPLRGRLILYLTPLIVLCMGAGAARVWDVARQRAPVVCLAFLGLLFIHPVLQASYHLAIKPRIRQELKPVLLAMKQELQEGDTIYVYHWSLPAFDYYVARRGLLQSSTIVRGVGEGPQGDVQKYAEQIDRLRGRGRVWFVFSHSALTKDIDDEQFFVSYLNRVGVKKQENRIMNEIVKPHQKTGTGASTYLYELPAPVPHKSGN